MCDPMARLCSYVPVEDGTLCDLGGSSGVCRSGRCQPEPECELAEDCEDENDCTQDLCVDGWCEHDVRDQNVCLGALAAFAAGGAIFHGRVAELGLLAAKWSRLRTIYSRSIHAASRAPAAITASNLR